MLTPNAKNRAEFLDEQSIAGMVYLGEVKVTEVAAINVFGVFNDRFDDYVLIGDNINNQAGTSQLQFRFSNAGVLDSGSNYYDMADDSNTTTAAAQFQLAANQVNTARGINFHMTIQNTNESDGIRSAKVLAVSQTNGTPTYQDYSHRLAYTGAIVTGFGLYWTSGANFTPKGSVKIYGVTK